ncbi:hypothetical protein AMJ85_01190 [candidate division BRC1 bacterium SM23_51]|nr:MAG: hypothetical protein AMJ85_01190 [candidate division BRC1 bacterium SM23_51]
MRPTRQCGESPNVERQDFRPYRCGMLRGVCVEGYEAFDLAAIPWDEIKRRPDPNHELAKTSRTRRVVRLEFAPAGQPPRAVYAKRVLVRDWRKRLGCLFVPSKARHEWQAGYRLLAMGLATARPVVCAEQRRGPWLHANYLVTEEIADARPLRLELERVGSAHERRDLLGAFARWFWQVHSGGFYHDDCSTQHVFVSPHSGSPAASQRRFWLIDLDNCRFHRATVPWRRRVKNLFQVLRSIPPRWASRTDRLHLVQSYLTASGESEQLDRALNVMRRLARSKETNIHL